ncbi:MAG: putative lipase [Rariglobus sp.]|jgi:triacylglycerol lipase|nr:putative lipase [Rariglobus sp.]
MNLPDILNVALGIVVLYVLLSSIGSLLLELLTRAAHYREEILYVTVNRLLAGAPDTPWSVSSLVLDRIGRRIPEDKSWFGLAGWLRRRWIKEYQVIAPGRSDADPKRKDIVQRFWSHPKIRSLAIPGADAPSSMDPATFANVVIDIAVPRDAQRVLPDNRLALLRALAAPSEDTPDALRQTLRTLGLSSEIPAGATGEALWAPFRANLIAWFNEASARATDIYRVTMQRLLLVLGFVLALVLNADTIRTIHLLSHDRPLREAVAAYSETFAAEKKDAEPSPGLKATREALGQDIERLRDLESIGFPLGWSSLEDGYFGADTWFAKNHSGRWGWLLVPWAFGMVVFFKLAGLGVTALAVSQGAPFWYGVMNRLIGLRKGQGESSPPAAAAATNQPAASGGTSATQVAPASVMPLEIGHDLAAPATGFNSRKAYWLARASAAAYSPKQEIEALVKDTWKFHEFHYFDKQGTQGFCAADDQIVLIAFRGTELADLNDVLADVNVRLVMLTLADYANAPSRRVHQGFHDALGLVWGDLSAKIMEWTAERPGRAARQIFITGHSLGGAIATLMFARLASVDGRPVPTLVTFGCPKVGDTTFTRELDRLYPERAFRLVNDSDIVPHLPPLSDFHHAGREFTFDASGVLRSEISGLGRLLGYAAGAARSITTASRKAVDDHGVAYYVARCEVLATKAGSATA